MISFLTNEPSRYWPILSIHDAIKHNAHQVIQQLIDDGIEVVIATGDHEQNAELVATGTGHSTGSMATVHQLKNWIS